MPTIAPPRPHRPRAATSPAPPTTPCYDDPEGWSVPTSGTVDDAAATIRSAVAGCHTCYRTHRAAYDACATAPPHQRAPLTVMAGQVVTVGGAFMQPGRYIRAYLRRLLREAARRRTTTPTGP